jgi:hypothetical protein
VEKGRENARQNGLQNVTFLKIWKKMSQSSRGRVRVLIKYFLIPRGRAPLA